MDEVIKTKRGLYGRVNVTLPLPVKTAVLGIQKKSGIRKAEFLRLALLIGTNELDEKIIEAEEFKNGGIARSRPPGREEDGLLAMTINSPTLVSEENQ